MVPSLTPLFPGTKPRPTSPGNTQVAQQVIGQPQGDQPRGIRRDYGTVKQSRPHLAQGGKLSRSQ